jgi:hypothetical protein
MAIRTAYQKCILSTVLITLAMVIINPNHVQAQTKLFYGFVISDENAVPVQLASVLVIPKGTKTLSNRKGYFKIEVQQSDTIRISAVGFETLFLPVGEGWISTSDTLTIMLSSNTYKLNTITIVASNARRDSIARVAAEILKNDPLLNNYDRVLNRPRGGGLSGVITEMYYEFSKAGQDMVKFEQFVKYYREQQVIDTKYNKEVVKRITRLDEFFLDEFIIFCRPDRQFLLTAPEYDIYKHILDCNERFRQRYGLKE